MELVLQLGSAPMATAARGWPRAAMGHLLTINNAWGVRPDWDTLIHPHDFPAARLPVPGPGQRIVTETDFVPAQNARGGFVFGGGTMAFTAGYWALHALRPRVIAVFGCDMCYPRWGPTHFYGRGAADPIRPDVTLQSLEAKAARLMILAAMEGCALVNLSTGPSRLVYPRSDLAGAAAARPLPFDRRRAERALAREAALGYVVPSGRYWEEADRFAADALAAIDALWLAAAGRDPGRAVA